MEQTRNYLLTREDYNTLKAHWSKTCRSKFASDHLIYNILRGFPADRGFTPSTKERNGREAGFTTAKRDAKCFLRLNCYDSEAWSFEKRYGIARPPRIEVLIDAS